MEQEKQLNAILDRPIVLTGLMGSGKSRIGSALATALELEFHDTDRLIEQKAGRTINEIFTEDGEPKFRDVEKKTVIEVLDGGVSVIATGGGAIMNPGIPEALKQKAYTVWLKTDIPELAERLSQSKNRPLLRDKNIEDVLSGMLEKRGDHYAKADIIVDTTGLTVQEAALEVIKGLSGFLKKDNL